jgi:hypothetical protein
MIATYLVLLIPFIGIIFSRFLVTERTLVNTMSG